MPSLSIHILLAGALSASTINELDTSDIFLADAEEEDEDVIPLDDLDLDVFGEALQDDWEDEAVERLETEDTLSPDGEELPPDEYFGGEEEDVFDFSDDEEEVPIGGPGQDSARIYRDFMDNLDDLGPDEESISWEEYLRKYPNTLFRDRIQARLDSLSEVQFDQRLRDDDWEDYRAAGMREIRLSAPRHLENIDPSNRIRAAFEWGFPSYKNLIADFEMQILRELSWHAGVRHRYTGWNLEAGTRYAILKSARTNTIVTGLLDIHANTDPFFPAVRPQIGAGKRFMVKGNPLDVQAQAGVDIEFRDNGPGMRVVGGGNVTYQASDKVAFFVETNIQAKHVTWDQGSFRFPVATFGITFNLDPSKTASLAANAPYANNYWGYHFGSIMGDFDLYY